MRCLKARCLTTTSPASPDVELGDLVDPVEDHDEASDNGTSGDRLKQSASKNPFKVDDDGDRNDDNGDDHNLRASSSQRTKFSDPPHWVQDGKGIGDQGRGVGIKVGQQGGDDIKTKFSISSVSEDHLKQPLNKNPFEDDDDDNFRTKDSGSGASGNEVESEKSKIESPKTER